jgi:hypothetical protein
MGKNDKIQEAGNSPALLELQRMGANSAVTDTPSASSLSVRLGNHFVAKAATPKPIGRRRAALHASYGSAGHP